LASREGATTRGLLISVYEMGAQTVEG